MGSRAGRIGREWFSLAGGCSWTGWDRLHSGASVRLGLLSNCRAGLSRASPTALEQTLKEAPEVVHVKTRSSADGPEALARLAHHGVTLLAVDGGDGTLQRVLTEVLSGSIFEPLPALAPLPGGRTNMSAADMGRTASPATGLIALLCALRTNTLEQHVVKRPVLRVDSGPGTSPQYGMFFGAGVIQRALAFKHQLYPKRCLQGLFGAGLFLGGAVLRVASDSPTGIFAPDEMGLAFSHKAMARETSAGQLATKPFQLVMATTLKRLFLRLCPFWGHESASLRFTAITANAMRSPVAVWRVLRGLPPPPMALDSGYCSHNVERLTLQMDCGYTIDGELFEPQPGRTLYLATDHRLRFIRASVCETMYKHRCRP